MEPPEGLWLIAPRKVPAIGLDWSLRRNALDHERRSDLGFVSLSFGQEIVPFF